MCGRVESQILATDSAWTWWCRLFAALDTNPEQQEAITEFFLALATCHTVIAVQQDGADDPEGSVRADSDSDSLAGNGEVEYHAASPDEAALVRAARSMGFKFLGRRGSRMTVSIFGREETYELLAVNEFNSTRKRMSVLLRRPDGTTVLLCKGADSAILPDLKQLPPVPRYGRTAGDGVLLLLTIAANVPDPRCTSLGLP